MIRKGTNSPFLHIFLSIIICVTYFCRFHSFAEKLLSFFYNICGFCFMGLIFLLTRTETVSTLGPRYILPILWHWNASAGYSALALCLINEKEHVPWKNGPGTSQTRSREVYDVCLHQSKARENLFCPYSQDETFKCGFSRNCTTIQSPTIPSGLRLLFFHIFPVFPELDLIFLIVVTGAVKMKGYDLV